MKFRNAPALPAFRALVLASTTTILTLAAVTAALAQATPAPAPAPKAQPKQLPKAQPQAPAQPAPPAQANADQPQLFYSPWTKYCLSGPETNGQKVCFTSKEGRIETGQPVVGAALIEPDNDPKKILQVNLPLGLSLVPGTRIIVDGGQPLTSPYVYCLPAGCTAHYEASDELIGKLKKGQVLTVQGLNTANQPVTLSLPLSGFDKAYDGAPTDPKVYQAQEQKLQEDLQKRADESRKRLEVPPAAH